MKVNAGLWIDSMKALIVITFDGGEKKLEIQAQPEVEAADRPQRASARVLNRFYAEVIGAIRDAEAFLIFGPGEAKDELRNHLVRARLGDKVAGVEPAEYMTEHQLAAKLRERFEPIQAH